MWCGSASPIVNVLRENGYRLRVHYAVTYLKPPLVALLSLARIRGLNNITDQEIQVGAKMHLQYLDFVISSENVDVAHSRWEDMMRSSVVREL